ncbi:MAG: TIGR02677 family protein [Mycobacteriales bacterium]
MSPAPVDRLRLTALRYAVNDEAAHYIAVMRVFTDGTAGLLSDLSAREVGERLADQYDLELDIDLVDARLTYLVEHGNLARSPRETEARSIREYLITRARYQLTQRGELVHRQVEDLLGAADEVREVSTEMLGGILSGLRELVAYDEAALATVEPDVVAGQIATVFAQFERLVTSTREFYTHLGSVLTRYDLGREDFQAFKAALLDYLQRFVDEIARTMPQIGELVRELEPRLAQLLARADTGARLLGVDGTRARRSRGLEAEDWAGLRTWFLGRPGRRSDADEVRTLATRAMRSLLVNLRRLATSADREVSRYADLLRLARWFDDSSPEQAHALWAGAFGLYSCRHLGFVADPDGDPPPATSSWWRGPVADVPVMLRTSGERKSTGATARREDFAATKGRRVAEREAAEAARQEALRELARARGAGLELALSEPARATLLELYARALSGNGGPLSAPALSAPARATAVLQDGQLLLLQVSRTPGVSTRVRSPAGVLDLVGLSLRLS